MSEEISFTQEQLQEEIGKAKNEWMEKELNPIIQERDGLLQFKPKDLSDEEKAIQTKQQELFQKELSIELKSAGLEKFADFFKVEKIEDLQPQIEKFQGLLNEIKVSMGYVPADHSKSDAYSVAEQKKDVSGMLSAKLSKLFG
ncbi:hypothetical protein J7E38_14130 [Bacillus sp. ISL-35]|uniref:hypothetical protein n=1 Tax=Bacillus sp. ISL-35 TaxID=2819122 RepID=UPI001BEA3368|nr:hypothetical protein [Bacillus sp. ISL-35]MBT2680149.1 hypothetical protein [Bacillus sp. ISL-35]MBT2704423.1 hypothetical protein [Chryseobacterium sp. ISL-80]